MLSIVRRFAMLLILDKNDVKNEIYSYRPIDTTMHYDNNKYISNGENLKRNIRVKLNMEIYEIMENIGKVYKKIKKI